MCCACAGLRRRLRGAARHRDRGRSERSDQPLGLLNDNGDKTRRHSLTLELARLDELQRHSTRMLSKATSTAPRSSPRSSITDASCWAPGAAARGLRLVAEPTPTETFTDRIEAALSALVARTWQGRSDDALIALEGLATALPRPLRF
jgi:hypothetical protein